MQRNDILYLKINYICLYTNYIYKVYSDFEIKLNIYGIVFHLNFKNVLILNIVLNTGIIVKYNKKIKENAKRQYIIFKN